MTRKKKTNCLGRRVGGDGSFFLHCDSVCTDHEPISSISKCPWLFLTLQKQTLWEPQVVSTYFLEHFSSRRNLGLDLTLIAKPETRVDIASRDVEVTGDAED